jgi:hypothetical protein
MYRFKKQIWLTATLLLTLTACGGGGSTPAPTTSPPAPTPSPPAVAATATLSFGIKSFRFSWADVAGATFYRVMEQPDNGEGFTQVSEDIGSSVQTFVHIVPLFDRVNAQYILQSCNGGGCTDATSISVSGNLNASIGYLKASNAHAFAEFGKSVSLSADGNTLAVGSPSESGSAFGIGGDQNFFNNLNNYSGAVYVFQRSISGDVWIQQEYIKTYYNGNTTHWGFGQSVTLSADGNTLAVGRPTLNRSNTGNVSVYTRIGTDWTKPSLLSSSKRDIGDSFGHSVSLSADGNTLAIGAINEGSKATGVNGDRNNNSTPGSGAVYVFSRSGNDWDEQAYLKSSVSWEGLVFGGSISLSGDGNTLVVGSTEFGSLSDGAVHVFSRSGSTWSWQVDIQGSNTSVRDAFGGSVSLSADGNTLAVGAIGEDSSASFGVLGAEGNNDATAAGAVYVFNRSGTSWNQVNYLKATNSGERDFFGHSVSLSADGNVLAVGAIGEDSNATGVDGDESDNSSSNGGAVYVFDRSSSNATTWNERAYLKSFNTAINDQFGYSVSLSADGNALAIGAINEGSKAAGVGGTSVNLNTTRDNGRGSGAVYLY